MDKLNQVFNTFLLPLKKFLWESPEAAEDQKSEEAVRGKLIGMKQRSVGKKTDNTCEGKYSTDKMVRQLCG
jgi:hypothetical protein